MSLRKWTISTLVITAIFARPFSIVLKISNKNTLSFRRELHPASFEQPIPKCGIFVPLDEVLVHSAVTTIHEPSQKPACYFTRSSVHISLPTKKLLIKHYWFSQCYVCLYIFFSPRLSKSLQVMEGPRVSRYRRWRPVWSVAANISNKQSLTVDKEWSSRFGWGSSVLEGAKILSPEKINVLRNEKYIYT